MYSADFTCSLNGSSSQVCVTRIAFRDQYLGFQIKIFREIISLSVVVCSFIDNISSKHDPETAASKLNLMLLTLIHASRLWMSANFIGFLLLGSVFGHFFDTQLMNLFESMFFWLFKICAVSLLLTESHKSIGRFYARDVKVVWDVKVVSRRL